MSVGFFLQIFMQRHTRHFRTWANQYRDVHYQNSANAPTSRESERRLNEWLVPFVIFGREGERASRLRGSWKEVGATEGRGLVIEGGAWGWIIFTTLQVRLAIGWFWWKRFFRQTASGMTVLPFHIILFRAEAEMGAGVPIMSAGPEWWSSSLRWL